MNLWPEVIGPTRSRYFILTQQTLDAETAKAWGVVNEIVPADRLLPRAHELADGITNFPTHQPLHLHGANAEAAPDCGG